MANPYHDETGRFCSKGEMGEAVDRLYAQISTTGNEIERGEVADRWFELKREYEQINRGVVEIPEEWVATVSSSGLQNPLPNSAQGIETIYRSGLSDELRKRSDFHTSKAVGLFTNEHTPQWIKDELYREASPEIKAGIIEELSGWQSEEKYPEITSEDLLPFTWGDNGGNPKVTKALLGSNRLGFDAKYQLAKNRGQLGWLLAQDRNSEASRYARIPDLEADLKREWGSPLRPQESRDYAAQALARNTDDADLRAKLLETDSGHVMHGQSMATSMAQNPHLSQAEGVALLERTLKRDSASFGLVSAWLNEGQQGEGNPLTVHPDFRSRQIADTKAYGGFDSLELGSAEAKMYDEYTPALEQGVERFPGVNPKSREFSEKVLGLDKTADYFQQRAILDAEPGRYEELRKESKELEKLYKKALRKGDRSDARVINYDQQVISNRISNARTLRVNSLVLEQIKADVAQQAADS